MSEPIKNRLQNRRQWILSKNVQNKTANWLSIKVDNEHILQYQKDAKVQIINTSIGLFALIGIVTDLDGELKNLDVVSEEQLDEDLLHERIARKLGGTYVLIFTKNNDLTVYNDPAGLMGVYYDKTGRAASSPNLLTPLLPDLLVENSFRFSKGNDWYTGSTTPYSGVKKLFPNCSLELKTGRIKRYWPKPSDFQFTHNTTDGKIQKICDLLKGGISSALAQGQVLCSITGGQDSRVVLAACKDSWQAIDFFTIKADWVARDDISLAALLAKTTSINHKFIDYASTPAWLDELYNEIGANESIGARREIAGTCLQLEGHNKIHINGNLGALCKSYYWHNTHPKEFKISAVTRDFIDPGKIIFDGISEWVSTIVEIKEAHILYNLFYLEQRGGRWISAGENCSRLFYESFTPFNHREIFCLISSLPLELQCSGKLLKIFVQKLAPELLHVSYCRTRRKYSKYIPEKFKNKLRKLFKR
ncbi:MAG: hypothetical protein EOM59_12465 [Clostridia bacterium]|nr:hypothetical protein [Clostridia bacterium]